MSVVYKEGCMSTVEQSLGRVGTPSAPAATCDPATRVTKSLLGYGVIAGPVYTAAWLTQATTRPGFSLRTDAASLLANGRLGWIQVANFLAAGAMVVAASIGIGRALRGVRGGAWARLLVALFGLGIMAAGLFKADPMDGFPAGTPAGPPRHTTWHGSLHFVVGGIGFLGLIAATVVLARVFLRAGSIGWARISIASGAAFLAANVLGGVLGSHHEVASNLTLTAGVVGAWLWLSAVSLHFYRTANPPIGENEAAR
jgi:hypothetical protein